MVVLHYVASTVSNEAFLTKNLFDVVDALDTITVVVVKWFVDIVVVVFHLAFSTVASVI